MRLRIDEFRTLIKEAIDVGRLQQNEQWIKQKEKQNEQEGKELAKLQADNEYLTKELNNYLLTITNLRETIRELQDLPGDSRVDPIAVVAPRASQGSGKGT